MDGETLAGLIRGAQRGAPESFDRLVDVFASRVFGFILRMTGSPQDAEDLMQEVFLRVVRMIGAYRHDDRFEAWLFRIAANLVRDRARRARRAPRLVSAQASGDDTGRTPSTMDELPGSPAPADARLIRAEEIDALNAALVSLTDAEREVIMLRHFGELSFKEIAEVMGTPLGTALARAHRGLARLREIMAAAPESTVGTRRDSRSSEREACSPARLSETGWRVREA
jgi:RNA polymerase sigma-70 factor (ECF subfamily)